MPSLGALYSQDHAAITFTLWSPQATRVELCIYSTPMGADAILKAQMSRQADQRLTYTVRRESPGPGSGRLDLLRLPRVGTELAVRCQPGLPGSQAGFLSDVDAAGNRFNPNKLLLDPYALEISHDPLTTDRPDPTTYQSGAPFRIIDTGLFAAKAIVIEVPIPDFGNKPLGALKDDIIYEVHLRGLTRNDPGVPANLQGTYAGAALKTGYLSGLGVTAVEFQPIHETQNGLNDDPEFASLHNYWGYDSIGFFAPDRHLMRPISWLAVRHASGWRW